MSPTMREVASRAGVSLKSVSRVVNGHPNTSAEVRARVEAAIAELGWSPNTHARSLRTGRSGLIALSLPDLRTSSASQLAQALVTEAERQGLRVAIEPSHGEAARVRRTLDARGAVFDAVVHLGPLPADLPDLAADPGHPVVLVRAAESLDTGPGGRTEGLDSVDIDAVAAAEEIHRHLRIIARSRVVVIGREEGAADGVTSALGAAFSSAPVLRPDRDADRAAGRELAARALARVPEADALVCASDELALGVLSQLLAQGIAVPGQVAVTGHGNIDDGQFTTPTLTTADLGAAALARHVLDLVRARLDGDRSPARRIVLPVRVVRRESTLGRDGIGAGADDAATAPGPVRTGPGAEHPAGKAAP
ncbi:LacI family DNA-binding transcriptional regulator [Brachybacterium hainanense]|uniref:LacI family DNA-binding transcriptional regulator n=1 Tax=Brachybacterium hainanense TaxID=1541174 RepID=A0ABV6RCB5_9MICO